MKTYGYARVSTRIQADEGQSLGAQTRAVQGYCMMKNMPDPRMFVERGVSGSIPFAERTEGAALLALLQPGDALIVPKLDRAFRSALDALDVFGKLKTLPVSFHIIDLGGDVMADGMSKLVFTILAAVAEGERDRIRERIRDVKGDQRKRGMYLGGVKPWGFEVDKGGKVGKVGKVGKGVLIELPERAPAIEEMKALRANGESLRSIASTITRDFGISICYAQVKHILDKAVSE